MHDEDREHPTKIIVNDRLNRYGALNRGVHCVLGKEGLELVEGKRLGGETVTAHCQHVRVLLDLRHWQVIPHIEGVIGGNILSREYNITQRGSQSKMKEG